LDPLRQRILRCCRKLTTVAVVSAIVGLLGIEHFGLNDFNALPMQDQTAELHPGSLGSGGFLT